MLTGANTGGTWQEELYWRIFDEETRGLERRRQIDPDFGVESLLRLLQDLYQLDGQDWLGRGEVGDITSAATLAAHERFAAELQAAGT